MNCKPGELAIVVRSTVGNEGRIVRCLHLASDGDMNRHGVWIGGADPVWLLDGLCRWVHPLLGERLVPFMTDSALRPIRDNDGEDETLTWAGKPEEALA